jgi:hypothetical protein
MILFYLVFYLSPIFVTPPRIIIAWVQGRDQQAETNSANQVLSIPGFVANNGIQNVTELKRWVSYCGIIGAMLANLHGYRVLSGVGIKSGSHGGSQFKPQ